MTTIVTTAVTVPVTTVTACHYQNAPHLFHKYNMNANAKTYSVLKDIGVILILMLHYADMVNAKRSINTDKISSSFNRTWVCCLKDWHTSDRSRDSMGQDEHHKPSMRHCVNIQNEIILPVLLVTSALSGGCVIVFVCLSIC